MSDDLGGPPVEDWPALLTAHVTARRDQLVDGGIDFAGVRFQTRPGDRENVAGAAQLAFMALIAGAQPGDHRWHGGDADFGWIAEDNSVVPMDAPTVVAFAKAVAARKEALIFAARTIKDAIRAGKIASYESVEQAFAAAAG